MLNRILNRILRQVQRNRGILMTQKRDITPTKYEPICRVASTPVFWYGSGSSILGWIQIRIQGFDEQKLKNMYSFKKNLIFLDQKLQFTYP